MPSVTIYFMLPETKALTPLVVSDGIPKYAYLGLVYFDSGKDELDVVIDPIGQVATLIKTHLENALRLDSKLYPSVTINPDHSITITVSDTEQIQTLLPEIFKIPLHIRVYEQVEPNVYKLVKYDIVIKIDTGDVECLL